MSRFVLSRIVPLVVLAVLSQLSPQIVLADHAAHSIHTWKTTHLNAEFYSEGAAVGDFNRDGKMDIVSGPFWFAGPDFQKRHAYYEPKPFNPLGYSDNFFAYSEDIDGDGWTDILIYGFPGKDASWFQNPQGRDRFWQRHKVLDVVDNESPTFVDLTGDGRREIVCSQDGYFGYVEPNRDDPTRPWVFKRISTKSTVGRFTHGMGIGDVNGDGRLDLLEKKGWWEQPASLNGNPVWKHHAVAFSGPGGAQMFAYDLDGDGDNDVITSLAAHGYGLAWHEHVKVDNVIQFRQHLIMGDSPEQNRYGLKFAQLHAIDLVDIDGDGLKDIITGKRHWAHGPKGDAEPNAPSVLYWFRTVRKKTGSETVVVDFVPYLISDESGVGVEVKARDVNGDGAPDVIVGNKKGTWVHIQSRVKVSHTTWARAQPMARDNRAQKSGDGLPPDSGLSPQEAAKAMTVPKGFKVELVAGEPLVHQPIALATDERGRLWIAEAYTYPIRAPKGKGKDKIIILEDKDHNGSFETRTVFAEGLNLISGLEVGFGGVWVGAAPYLMFIPDKNHDDKPDGPPQILLDGFGYEDTHETLNSFVWGPDGWLYGCHGVFTHSRVGKPGTPAEQRTPLNCGVWRYHPVRHEFDIFARGSSNPWGVDFDDYGQTFITACVIPHLFHMIQGGRYHRQGGRHFNPYIYDDIKTIADHAHYAGNIRDHAWWGRNNPVAHSTTDKAGGGHAHCGAMIYLGDNWPDRYRNSIFMSNIHGNRINNDVLHRKGSGFFGSHGDDFLFANDRWFRGINMRYGPDGGVYLIDWYDKNACHRRTPEIWDRTNGRVYKITFGEAARVANADLRSVLKREDVPIAAPSVAKNATVSKEFRIPSNLASQNLKPRIARNIVLASAAANTRLAKAAAVGDLDLTKLSDAQLVNLHFHKNDWFVRTARRLLQERASIVRGSSNQDSPNANKDVAHLLLKIIGDNHRDVTRRLRALWTLHAIGGVPEATTASLLSASGANTEYLRGWAIQLELEDHKASKQFVSRLAELSKTDSSAVVRLYLTSALQQLPLDQRWAIAAGLLQHGEDVDDHNLPLIIWYGVEPLVMQNTAKALSLANRSKLQLVSRYIYRRAASDPVALETLLTGIGDTSDEAVQQMMLEEITAVVKTRANIKMPKAWPDIYVHLSKSKSSEVRDQAQFITVKFGDKSIFPALRSIVADSKANTDSRRRAMAALLSGNDSELPPLLHRLLSDSQMRGAAVRGLARFDNADTDSKILAHYKSFKQDEREDAITTLASRPTYATALLDAIGRKEIPRNDLTAFTVRQMQRFRDPAIVAKLNKVWGSIRSTAADKKKMIAQLKQQLTRESLAKSHLTNGRAIYKKTCAKCHKLFGDGGTIGPDITGGNRANLDFILENILDPSAVVGRNYQLTSIQTSDGRTISGLIKEENDSAVVLQTVNEVIVVALADIEERKKSTTSIMPEGQLKQLKPNDIRDLIAYLASSSQVPLPGESPVLNPKTMRVDGAIEGERMKILAKTAGNARSQQMSGFRLDKWSGTDHLWWTGAKPGDRLTLQIRVASNGRYELYAVMTKAQDYGIFQLHLDGKKIGKPIDLFNSRNVITTKPVSYGTFDLKAGPHRLTFEAIGANPKAIKGYMFGLDYVYLARQTEPDKAEKK